MSDHLVLALEAARAYVTASVDKHAGARLGTLAVIDHALGRVPNKVGYLRARIREVLAGDDGRVSIDDIDPLTDDLIHAITGGTP